MISIIVVTFNRKTLLERCIESLIAQDYPGEYEIIIIDNGSADGAGELIKDRFNGRVRFIENDHEKGLSACKNIGIKISRGDTIAFTDDDCFVTSSWLNSIETSLKNGDVAGGPVFPSTRTDFPLWWRDSLNWQIGLHTVGNEFRPIGSNVAFKRKVFDKIGYYNIEINRTSDNLLFGEDNDILKRALNNGLKVTWNDKMVVYHAIPRKRLKFSYLIWRSYMEGMSLSIRERSSRIFVLKWLALAINPLRFLVSMDPNLLFRTIVSIGYINGYRHRRSLAA